MWQTMTPAAKADRMGVHFAWQVEVLVLNNKLFEHELVSFSTV